MGGDRVVHTRYGSFRSLAEAERARPTQRGPRPCVWRLHGDLDYADFWATSCHEQHVFFEDGPTKNSYRFCPYCGKILKESQRRVR